MVYFTAVTASLLLSTLVSAQSDDSALGIAAIKAHFSNAGLVPALLETFEPQGTLTLNFDGRRMPNFDERHAMITPQALATSSPARR